MTPSQARARRSGSAGPCGHCKTEFKLPFGISEPLQTVTVLIARVARGSQASGLCTSPGHPAQATTAEVARVLTDIGGAS